MSSPDVFPSGPIQSVSGSALVLRGDDIDTDRIIPARFLKCVSFDALGDQVFADDRTELAGDHPFDRSENQAASILIVNDNFGCGSSREHAPQALMRWGIRAVIGESFAEIFFGNCLALGIPCAAADHELISSVQDAALSSPGGIWTLDLNTLSLTGSDHQAHSLMIAQGPRDMLLSGRWDATSELLAAGSQVDQTHASLPYLNGFR
ncbi:MAG: isopropylmalate isomerase [Synechococcus sp. CPC35]|nr:isopropylmalate isomerase [Synechococcus sp. CPC35]|tara:strand:- start:2629 stop:3249 length:621 start_codon:yes stop_codon:yes gene_type:complete